jgi:S1-C subfamily serine protease
VDYRWLGFAANLAIDYRGGRSFRSPITPKGNPMLKKSLMAAVLAVVSMPASAWEDVKGMNEQIDQTNFIVGRGCSGTLISIEHRLIVTAHHCIAGDIRTVTRDVVGADGKISKSTFERRNRVTVQQKDYDRFDNIGSVSYQTEILAYKQERDLAILQLVGENLRSTMAAPVLPADEKIYRGEPVTAVGNPRMLDASVTTGVISSTSRTFAVSWALGEHVPFLQFDANIQPGSSGGALFDSRGRYIGTTVAAFPGSDLSLAIPVYELHELLAANCLASVYDASADDAECEAEKRAAADGEDTADPHTLGAFTAPTEAEAFHRMQ